MKAEPAKLPGAGIGPSSAQENARQKKDTYFTESYFVGGGQAWNNGQLERTVVANNLRYKQFT